MTTATKPETESTSSEATGITIRPVETRVEYDACIELQRATWGRSFSDIVPVSMMGVAVKMGGICLGAFDRSDELLGFVFGVTGPRDGEIAHWSHMLAVRGEARNAGIGRRLKLAQRAALADRGIDTLYWTFDPLVARNAHFNLNRLGASIAEFVPDMYGASDSCLHRLGTDRFIAQWSLKGGTGVCRSPSGEHAAGGHPCLGRPGCNGHLPNGADVIEVPVPRDIDAVVEGCFDEALAWRRSNRRALTRLFSEGYDIMGFSVGGEYGTYILARGRGVPAVNAHGV